MEMSDQQLNHKGNHESDCKLEQVLTSGESGESVKVMKAEGKGLTNIYYDCLERIFDFLDMESLLNVADTCKRLQIAAAAKFGGDYGTKPISLLPFHHEPKFSANESELFVYSSKLHLPFLRCFGAKISKLSLSHLNGTITATQNAHWYEYINRYCADTLKSITFHRSTISAELFSKPFKNVESVRVQFSLLEDQLPNFVSLFPNLRELQLLHFVKIDENATSVSFPHLKHLHLYILAPHHLLYKPKNAADLLHSNGHLQSLTIQFVHGYSVSLNELLDLICANTSLTKLQIIMTNITAMNTVEIDRLANEHPLIEELIFSKCFPRFTVDEVMMFVHQVRSLKRFEFEVSDRLDCDRILSQLHEKWKHEVSIVHQHFKIILNC